MRLRSPHGPFSTGTIKGNGTDRERDPSRIETQPLGHTTSMAYDTVGNLINVTDALGHVASFAHNGNGLLSSVTDALQNTTTFTYNFADLVGITDALQNTTIMFYDDGGRVTSRIDPLGHTTKYQYNSLDRVTQVTDPSQGITTFTYDPNGNLLSVQDTKQQGTTNKTVYTYSNMDRLQTRTDPLLRQESLSYDLNGNLVSGTDRRNKVTTFQYDSLNRRKFAGYGTVAGTPPTYESTVSYSYDGGNRLTSVVDSGSGTITPVFDGLNRLTSETTPQGSVTYTYDLAGRRKTTTVGGQTTINYTYDDANHLQQITQGALTLSAITYDNANRRQTITLSNGIVLTYGYDNASRLTSMSYQLGTNTLGILTYTLDAGGRRIQLGGSLARSGFPQAVTSAQYDVNNELTQWNGTNVSYDLNGNIQNDGTNTYTWNARNQLLGRGGVTFQYDPYGRRTRNFAGNNLLYDGGDVTQELSSTTPVANRVVAGTDQFANRTDSTGTVTPITDRLGSVLALADASGNLVTQYTYDPFGNTSAMGAASSNTAQYTGRESDSNGLYYYRARYYNPQIGRFISEDPLEFGGGDVNLYAYVGNNPISRIDPFGLDWLNNLADFSAGAGSALSFGLTDVINDATGASSVVNKCSGWHTAGTVAGIALITAIGGAAGAEAAEANAGEKGFEFSHWIPDRVGGPRSIFNGNYVSEAEHALSDPFRYRFMDPAWKARNPMNPAWEQQWDRIPLLLKGAGAGAAAGGASAAMDGRNCGCN